MIKSIKGYENGHIFGQLNCLPKKYNKLIKEET